VRRAALELHQHGFDRAAGERVGVDRGQTHRVFFHGASNRTLVWLGVMRMPGALAVFWMVTLERR
jgi:hypothetical protein